jgi:uncharacterized Zn-binding protein involved in type VI secretion
LPLPLAATLGDQTSHGTPLSPGPGSPNVFIGGKPAWRTIIDKHTCPLTSGSTPHVGGVVKNGSVSVLINGFFAARMGDSVTEETGPNMIVSGVMNVLIG